MDLTSPFTPRSECLSTYVLKSFFLPVDNIIHTTFSIVGEFQVRSSVFIDSTTYHCIPQGKDFSGVQSISPGLSCPVGWVTQSPWTEGESTTTIYCCPRTLAFDIDPSNVLLCVATMDSGTLFYQLETEGATTYTELHLPQVFVGSQQYTTVQKSPTLVTGAVIWATPLMLVWESTDIIVTATPSKISNPRPPTATATTNVQQETRPSLSSGTVAAISTSAALSVILLIAAFLFHRASKRRSSNNNPQPSVSAEKKPSEEVKAEMEDPLSAQTLFTQSGAYRGKPELGNDVNKPCLGNLDNADTNLSPISNDQSAAGSAPGDRITSVSVGAHPAELE